MAKSRTASAVSVSAEVPAIEWYYLLGDAGAVTAKGYFVRSDGKQTGASVNTAIPLADGVNNPVQLATSIPTDAVGFIGNLSGGVRWGLNYGATNDAALFADLKANYANYPLVAAGNSLSFGAVAVV